MKPETYILVVITLVGWATMAGITYRAVEDIGVRQDRIERKVDDLQEMLLRSYLSHPSKLTTDLGAGK